MLRKGMKGIASILPSMMGVITSPIAVFSGGQPLAAPSLVEQ